MSESVIAAEGLCKSFGDKVAVDDLSFSVPGGSSAFVPTDQMHDFVRRFAEVQPVSVLSDAARALSAGVPAEGAVLGSIAWIVGLTVVFAALAAKAYRRP